MAEIVLLAAAPLPAAVVCDDDEVRAWAERVAAPGVVWCPGRGLERRGGRRRGRAARPRASTRAIVAHADLPARHPARLAWPTSPGVTLVPDRRDDGTNVSPLPTDVRVPFSYGPGSFARHRAEAARLGLPARVVRDPHLGWDVDLPADLAYPGAPSWAGSDEPAPWSCPPAPRHRQS